MPTFVGISDHPFDDVVVSADLTSFAVGATIPVGAAQIGKDTCVAASGGRIFFSVYIGGGGSDVCEYNIATQAITYLDLPSHGLDGSDNYWTSVAWCPTTGRLYVAANRTTVGAVIGYWDGAAFTVIADNSILEPELDGTWTGAICIGKGLNAGTVWTLSGNQPATFHSEVLRYDPNTLAWTSDASLEDPPFERIEYGAAQLYGRADGSIVLGTGENGGGTVAEWVYQRDPSGAWTNITDPTMLYALAGAETWGIVEHGGDLYVGWFNYAGGGVDQRYEIWKRTSGGVWSLDFDILADDPATVGLNQFVIVGSRLIGCTGLLDFIYERGVSTWSRLPLDVSAAIWQGGAGGMTVTFVDPPTGDVVGGNTVEITGTGFDTDVEVVFDNVFPLELTWNSDTSLTAVVPPRSVAGLVNVTATNPDDGEYAEGGALYEYVNSDLPLGVLPAISWMGSGCNPGAIVPNTGTMLGGTAVTIHGVGFIAGSEVYFGGLPATSVAVDPSGTFITCVTPAQQAGAVDIEIISPP